MIKFTVSDKDLVDGQEKEFYQNELLNRYQNKFTQDLAELGFEKFDINILIGKGIASLDKRLAVDQLADLNKDVKIRMYKDKLILDERERKKKEAKERAEKIIATQGDIRDNFKIKIPFLAQSDFKPL